MEKQTETPLFETTLTWSENLLVVGQIALGFFGLFYFASKYTKDAWAGILFICIFFVIWIIQTIRGVKTFHLFSNRLVIKRPFFFTDKTDHVFKIDELDEVIFRRVKGRFGGLHLVLKSKRLSNSYRIDFGPEISRRFIHQLENLDVKVS